MSDADYLSPEERLAALESRVGAVEETATEATRQRDESSKRQRDGLSVSLRRREDQGMAEIGVTFNGAFIPLQVVKLGHLDKLVGLAKDRAERDAQSESQE